MQRARILIQKKACIFDGEAKAIQDGLIRLGFEHADELHVGKTIEIRMSRRSRDELKLEIDRMCEELLVNPVLEEYSIEFLDEE